MKNFLTYFLFNIVSNILKKKYKREKINKKNVTNRERLYQYVKFYMDIGIVEPSIIEKKTKISRVRANYIIKF